MRKIGSHLDKRGEILIENVIFLVLNLIYLTILILFIARQGTGVLNIEESYAKQIALLIDSSKPFSVFYLDMEDAINLATKNLGESSISDIIIIKGNTVTVKISEKGGSSYSFFNDVDVTIQKANDKPGFYFRIDKK